MYFLPTNTETFGFINLLRDYIENPWKEKAKMVMEQKGIHGAWFSPGPLTQTWSEFSTSNLISVPLFPHVVLPH